MCGIAGFAGVGLPAEEATPRLRAMCKSIFNDLDRSVDPYDKIRARRDRDEIHDVLALGRPAGDQDRRHRLYVGLIEDGDALAALRLPPRGLPEPYPGSFISF